MSCAKSPGFFGRSLSGGPVGWTLCLVMTFFYVAWSHAAQSQPVPIWVTFTSENSELPDNRIWALAPDADGALWVGTVQDGLAKLDKDGRWRSYTKASTK